MCVNICELVVVMAKVKDLKIQSFKPPAFDGEAENFRHWKSEFRAYLILNGQEHLEYLTESTKELEQDSSRLRGYERIAKVLDPANLKDDQHRINREKLGALLLKALPDGDKRKLNTELDRFLNQTIDFCVLWHALCHMYSERSVVARQALMQELFRAEKRRGESRLDFGERLMGVWTELNNLPDKPMKMPEEQLVYIIVYGLKDATFQMAFFGRSEPEQSLERLMNDLRLVEDQDGDQGSSSGDILTSMAGYQQRGYQHQRQPERRCGRCGGNHEERKCTFTGTCYNCGRIGHMRRLCRTKNDGRQQHQKKKNRTVKFNTSGASVIGAEVRRGSVLEPLEMREMKNVWGIDSMANGHSTTDLALLHDVRRVKNPPTVHGMTGQIRLELEGTVRLEVKSVDGRKGTLTVHNVFYNPVGVCNNLSEAILEAEGIKRVTGGIKLREGFILPFHAASGEMKLKLVEAEPTRAKMDTTHKPTRGGEPVRRNDEHVIVSNAAVSSKLWHRRLNHSSVSLKRLQQKVKGLQWVESEGDSPATAECRACEIGKHRKKSIPRKLQQAVAFGDRVYVDTSGRMPRGGSGHEYAQIVIDDHSRYSMLGVMSNKSDVHLVVKSWIDKFGPMGRMRFDNAKENLFGAMGDLRNQYNIAMEATCAYTPEQNGVAERRLTVIEAAGMAYCDQAELPYEEFWPYAWLAANYVQNRIPSQTTGQTPYFRRTGKDPDVSHLRVFGCRAYAHINKERRKKAEPKSVEGIFLGYADERGYVIWDPRTGTTHITKRASFHEGIPGGSLLRKVRGQSLASDMEAEATTVTESGGDWPEEPQQSAAQSELSGESVQNEPESDLREKMQNLNQEVANAGVQQQTLDVKIHKDDVTIPKSTEEARRNKHSRYWQEAEDAELKGFLDLDVFEEVSTARKKPVTSKFVYDVKVDENGWINRFKARLVAQGYSQQQGIDFSETYSPVGSFTSFRLLMAIAASRGIQPRAFDFRQAFLQGQLEEEIYLVPPVGDKVWRLKKAIYGLKQASRVFYQLLSTHLIGQGWVRCPIDGGLWRKGSSLLCMHVDDMLIVPSDQQVSEDLFQSLSSRFDIKDLGIASRYLKINITFDGGETYIDQSDYITDLLRQYGMLDSKAVATPATLTEDGDGHWNDIKTYREVVGKLNYLTSHTRPDIGYAVSIVGAAANLPKEKDWRRVKRILRQASEAEDYSGAQRTYLYGGL